MCLLYLLLLLAVTTRQLLFFQLSSAYKTTHLKQNCLRLMLFVSEDPRMEKVQKCQVHHHQLMDSTNSYLFLKVKQIVHSKRMLSGVRFLARKFTEFANDYQYPKTFTFVRTPSSGLDLLTVGIYLLN